MMTILDRMAARLAAFRPKSSTEYFALQLARQLGDTDGLQRYLRLAEECSAGQLVALYRRAVARSPRHGTLAQCYEQELRRAGLLGGHP